VVVDSRQFKVKKKIRPSNSECNNRKNGNSCKDRDNRENRNNRNKLQR